MKTKYFIFDLDDTLISEMDYLKSAYRFIANYLNGGEDLYQLMLSDFKNKTDVFAKISKNFDISKEELLEIYRYNMPKITLRDGALEILEKIKDKGSKIGLITDGRSRTQRNKIFALQIECFFNKIIISEEIGTEKPHENNYKIFIEQDIEKYFYIADNPKKDFITPNNLGWESVCLLDSGENIHPQNFHLPKEFLPNIKIKHLNELEKFL